MADETKLTFSPEARTAVKKANIKQTLPEGKAGDHPAPKTDAKADAPAAKTPAKAESKPAKDAVKEKPKREIVLERRFTLNLMKAYGKPRTVRSRTAIKILRAQCARHMKTALEAVKLDNKLNQFAMGSGGRNPVKRVTVIAQKEKSGMVSVTLAPMTAKAKVAKKA